MSAPAFAWALERGAALKLPPSERLVLIYLADMANGEKICWPGQTRIARYTGLALRTVISVLKKLADRQLIRVETSAGRVSRYHILRTDTPANSAVVHEPTHANRPVVTPANGAVVGHRTPANGGGEPLQTVQSTPANGADDPSSTQEEDPKRQVSEVFQDREEGKQAGSRLQPDATTGCDPLDLPADPGKIAAAIEELKRDLRMRAYPPRAAVLNRQEQIDATATPQARPAPLTPAHLAAMRQRAGYGRPVPTISRALA